VLVGFLFQAIHAATTAPHAEELADSLMKAISPLKSVHQVQSRREGTGGRNAEEPFWMEKIKHQGISPFNPDPVGYKVFRNVKASLFVGYRMIV
jgi:hypothetical protein